MLDHKLVPWIARVVLLVFGGWTALIVAHHGYTGFLELALAEHWVAQMLVDLVISLAIVLAWLIPDAQARGVSHWPYTLLTVFTGSIGPLLYLSLRTPSTGSDA